MPEKLKSEEAFSRKPRNKANMDQPQEEFIAPDSGHVEEEEHSPQPLTAPPAGAANDNDK